MTKAKPKFFITNRHTNRISHRKLSAFEERNPHLFELSHSAHKSWSEAHAWLVERRIEALDKAKKEVANAERHLARARDMKDPEAA